MSHNSKYTSGLKTFDMDELVSEFIAHTSADPGLAADLLDAHYWDFQLALSAYYKMKGILPGEVPLDDSEFESTHYSKNNSNACHSIKSDPPENNLYHRISQKKPPSVDMDNENGKKLTRGMSLAIDNFSLVSKARKEIAQDFDISDLCFRQTSSKLEIPDYTFTLPDLTTFPDTLREYLQKDLIETSTLVSLEQAGRLNWWHSRKICPKLWPLATTGDGNCLLHAASLGMWGFHDRLLTLRKALHSLVTNSPYTDSFYRRWRWQTALQNKEAGLIYCEEEWEKEWKYILKMSSSEPRQKSISKSLSDYSSNSCNGTSESSSEVYESLEELHVHALAHVLKRPIIVIADTVLKDVTGEPFAPIPFGGIYLPLECPARECHHSPLCLTYDSAHFSALVPMDEDSGDSSAEPKAAIPVTDPDNRLLPLQFAVDPGPDVKWGQDENDPWIIGRLTLTDKEKLILLNDYLDIRNIEVTYPEPSIMEKQSNGVNGHSSDNKYYDIYESDDSLTDGISCAGGKNGKSKAARQLQTVAKQFGSIGKSMSKKLKHIRNIARHGGSFKGETSAFKRASESLKNKRTLSGLPMMSRAATVDSSLNPRQIVVAVLNTNKKHEFQNMMIENYLSSAIARYEKDRSMRENVIVNERCKPTIQCINPGCTMYGAPSTSYLCSSCYKKQKDQEYELQSKRIFQKHIPDGAVIVSGKSSFYTDSGKYMMESVNKLSVGDRMSNGCYQQRNANLYEKYPCVNKVIPHILPECNDKLRSDDHSGLKAIKESATS